MKVLPLAAESLGVRSMATYVEVADLGILIDPGATLAPTRWGLPPAEPEWEALRRANDRISAYAARAALSGGGGLADSAASDVALSLGAAVLRRARSAGGRGATRRRQSLARARGDRMSRDHGSPRAA